MRKSAKSCCADAENDMQTEIRNDTGLPNVKHSPLTRIVLERFTAFEQLDLKLGPGINVFIGANGTGKTHLLKVAYAACEFKTTNIDYVMGPEGPFYHAYLPPLRRQKNAAFRGIEKRLESAIGGRVAVEGEEFFIENGNGKVEFTLLAEGLRKLGLLWLLVRNGSLPNGSVLFWDEPEANLNPGLLTVVVDVLLQLQRSGVQILIATPMITRS